MFSTGRHHMRATDHRQALGLLCRRERSLQATQASMAMIAKPKNGLQEMRLHDRSHATSMPCQLTEASNWSLVSGMTMLRASYRLKVEQSMLELLSNMMRLQRDEAANLEPFSRHGIRSKGAGASCNSACIDSP